MNEWFKAESFGLFFHHVIKIQISVELFRCNSELPVITSENFVIFFSIARDLHYKITSHSLMVLLEHLLHLPDHAENR